MSKLPLPSKQREVLKFVEDFIAQMGYSPTRNDIAVGFGYKSHNTVECHLRALARKGELRLISGISRGIALNAKGKK